MSMIETTDVERRIAERIDPKAAAMLELSQESGGLGFTSMAQAMDFAKVMAISGIAIPKHLRGNVGACMAVTIQAVEWKCSPFAVANKSYSVNDRLAYESQLVQAVILQRAPIKGRFKYSYNGEGEKRRCTVTATLINGDAVDYTSPEIGKIPVKNSPLWKGDPDQQLAYFSGRALCRRHFPDVLLGIYTPEEMAEQTRAHGPENARDVTPARTLAGRLDALAGGADPETGEIIDSAEADTQGAAPADQPPPANETGADAPEAAPEEHPLFTAGAQAAANGMSRKAVPGEIRDDKDHVAIWLKGFDSFAKAGSLLDD